MPNKLCCLIVVRPCIVDRNSRQDWLMGLEFSLKWALTRILLFEAVDLPAIFFGGSARRKDLLSCCFSLLCNLQPFFDTFGCFFVK